jgi:acetyltransferase
MAAPGLEVIVGCVRDPVFGFTVMFGLGGLFVEAMEDVAFRVAPIDAAEAAAMIAETRGSKLLDGVRGGPPLDRAALARVVAALSQLAVALPDSVRTLELNPLRVYPDGAVALDAVVLTGEGGS